MALEWIILILLLLRLLLLAYPIISKKTPYKTLFIKMHHRHVLVFVIITCIYWSIYWCWSIVSSFLSLSNAVSNSSLNCKRWLFLCLVLVLSLVILIHLLCLSFFCSFIFHSYWTLLILSFWKFINICLIIIWCYIF